MKTFEQNGKNFLIMILFMVFAISGAKALHDITVSESDQAATKMTIEKEVAGKH